MARLHGLAMVKMEQLNRASHNRKFFGCWLFAQKLNRKTAMRYLVAQPALIWGDKAAGAHSAISNLRVPVLVGAGAIPRGANGQWDSNVFPHG